MAQGDYQALAKLAAEEPRLARLKVGSALLCIYLFSLVLHEIHEILEHSANVSCSRARTAQQRIRYYATKVSGTRVVPLSCVDRCFPGVISSIFLSDMDKFMQTNLYYHALCSGHFSIVSTPVLL
ncbi:hypothetical protein X777_10655 [Ooceraea biroi]|uniref:Uncharacterized protein n=1 Tax=Ooceraea biroi TaxID=2015173 RepID=A0A026W313_OOCBI|nr:hypothetical protein X777_10655 [Ooceraea biroi]